MLSRMISEFICSLLPLLLSPLTDIRQWCINVAPDSVFQGNTNEVIVLANCDSSSLNKKSKNDNLSGSKITWLIDPCILLVSLKKCREMLCFWIIHLFVPIQTLTCSIHTLESVYGASSNNTFCWTNSSIVAHSSAIYFGRSCIKSCILQTVEPYSYGVPLK